MTVLWAAKSKDTGEWVEEDLDWTGLWIYPAVVPTILNIKPNYTLKCYRDALVGSGEGNEGEQEIVWVEVEIKEVTNE